MLDPNAAIATVPVALVQPPAADWLFQLLMSVSSLALGAAVWALTHLGLWASNQSKNATVRAMWLRADDAAVRAVKEVYQAYVDPLRKAGKWDADSAATAKRMAIEKVKELLTVQKGLGLASYILAGDTRQIDDFLGTFVESTVHDLSREQDTMNQIAQASGPPRSASEKPAAVATGGGSSGPGATPSVGGSSPPANPTPAPVAH